MPKILFFQDNNDWAEEIKKYGLEVRPLFKKIPGALKIFRVAHFKYELPFRRIWYSRWVDESCKYEIVIVPATPFTPPVTRYIDRKKLAPNIRLIYWYWDPVRDKYMPKLISSKWEKWSFDKADSIKFSLKYNSTYFFSSLRLPQQHIKFDIFFIGLNKGRLDKLLELKDVLLEHELSIYFHIVNERKFDRDKRMSTQKLTYSEVLKFISQSRAILELYQNNQTGLTLRSMESIFFKRKLITNNPTIKTYDFYCKDNIFIIGEDDINFIKEFVQSPYKEISTEIVLEYDFSSWLNRVVSNKALSI